MKFYDVDEDSRLCWGLIPCQRAAFQVARQSLSIKQRSSDSRDTLARIGARARESVMVHQVNRVVDRDTQKHEAESESDAVDDLL